MKLSDSFTRRKIAGASSVLAIGLVVAGFFVLRRAPRIAMERYAPARALAFVEVDSLADLVDGLTHTKAWRQLAPVLGLSSQLGQIGFVSDLIGRTGLGPDEAVVAGRAQYAIAITGIESNAGETDEGAYIHLKPYFVLIIETHMKPETAARIVRERAPAVAERIYGESVAKDTEVYYGTEVLIFRGPGSTRPLLVSALGSVVLIANDPESMTACLDSIAGRATSLAEDSTLKQMRSEVGSGNSVFGYVTASGIQKLVELWPLLALSRAADPDTASLVADMIEHVSKESVSGLLYSLAFESDGVTEKYLTMLRAETADALMEPLKPAPAASFASPRLIPRTIESLTLLSAERAGEVPERVLKRLSPTVDIVAGVALREFVINLRKQYGIEPSDSIGAATGSEIGIVNFGDDQPRAMLIQVSDKAKLEAAVARYLTRKGGSVTREQSSGVEIMVSSNDDRRAAAFVGDFLVFGTRDQIVKIVETEGNHDGLDIDLRFKQILASRPADASIVSYRSRVDDAGKLLLAISKLTRVTDGSPELLERDSAREALNRLPRSNSFTVFRGSGIYIETHSAVGNFSVLGSLFGDQAESR
jgi:hypothetical protein